MPEKDVMIIIDGKGWKKGAIPWLKESAGNHSGKNIMVFSLTDFITWGNKVV